MAAVTEAPAVCMCYPRRCMTQSSPRAEAVILTSQRRKWRKCREAVRVLKTSDSSSQACALHDSVFPWYKEAFTSEFKYGLGACKMKFIKTWSGHAVKIHFYIFLYVAIQSLVKMSPVQALSQCLLLREIPQIHTHLRRLMSQNRRKAMELIKVDS